MTQSWLLFTSNQIVLLNRRSEQLRSQFYFLSPYVFKKPIKSNKKFLWAEMCTRRIHVFQIYMYRGRHTQEEEKKYLILQLHLGEKKKICKMYKTFARIKNYYKEKLWFCAKRVEKIFLQKSACNLHSTKIINEYEWNNVFVCRREKCSDYMRELQYDFLLSKLMIRKNCIVFSFQKHFSLLPKVREFIQEVKIL